MKSYDVCVVGVERRKRTIHQRRFFFSKLTKKKKLDHGKNKLTTFPKQVNYKKATPSHIILKPLRTKDKRKNLISLTNLTKGGRNPDIYPL